LEDKIQREDHARFKESRHFYPSRLSDDHNYMRQHEALDGETPAERCGIKIEENNKWLTLIQNTRDTTKI
jgi:hypothetical protein